MDIDVVSTALFENITSRFLIFDIPVSTPLEELAAEIQEKNNGIIVEIRRFIKSTSTKETSPVLIIILGTTIPDAVKIWFIHQRVKPFIDSPRQCNKCYAFTHTTRVCTKLNLCYICGVALVVPCQQPENFIN
ncbi:unnamed protein product [Larinioides sclopetarius]|uniref:Uncharacterized protein n=1 Tax=Larinioides sclopetarius TaxID=280406 RepID=A0AAV1ZBX0_9ARAC